MMKYIVSACLVGINCKYDGKNNYSKKIEDLVYKGEAIPVCPEILGGLSTPRVPCEIIKKSSETKVINADGVDQTSNFIKGAEATLKIALAVGADSAIFQKRSPSCGVYEIYDGTHSNVLIKGQGITSKLLKENGLKVITEDDL